MTTPLDAQQKKASGILAYAIIIIFLAAQAGAAFIHPTLALFSSEEFQVFDGIAFGLSIVFAIVNFENTFVTNDNWKTYGGVVTVLYTVVMAALFISKGA